MRNSEVILVRHGHTAMNDRGILVGDSPVGLSDLGRQQAKTIGDFLGNKQISVLLSSPQQRAMETAQSIGARLNLPVSVAPELRERDYGPFDGLTRDELLERRKEVGADICDPTQHWLGIDTVESDQDIWRRVEPIIRSLTDHHNASVCVTHAGVIKAILHSAFQIPEHKRCCFRIPNGTVVIFKHTHEQLELNALMPLV